MSYVHDFVVQIMKSYDEFKAEMLKGALAGGRKKK